MILGPGETRGFFMNQRVSGEQVDTGNDFMERRKIPIHVTYIPVKKSTNESPNRNLNDLFAKNNVPSSNASRDS